MAIKFDPENRTFTLHTANTTYQMQVDHLGYLLHLYYGRRSEGCMDWLITYADRGFSGNPGDVGDNRRYSLDFLPQEFPVQGTGDFRSPLLVVRDEQGTYGCDLRYVSHSITNGKYSLNNLPAVYGNEENSQSLSIVLENRRLSLQVTLLYGVMEDVDVITRSVIVENRGTGKITVEKLQSACLDFVNGNYDLISFHGRHNMERQFDRRNLTHGRLVTDSRRGASSHQYNPFVILADHQTTEDYGRCWAMQFVYSGGFMAEAEVDQFDQTRLQMGLSDEKFAYPLAQNEKIIGPEVIMSFSDHGLSQLSDNLHRCILEHVCRGNFRDRERPVLLNSWEASYFDFDEQSLLRLARQAKEMDIEMFVLDDGWFGNRCDDKRALGDWTANEKKLGGSLARLIGKINDIGLKFGIWMEPEMISEDSDLYRSHPDWALAIPKEKPVRGRSQLVLDFSRQEVRDEIYKRICDVLDQGNIEYLKWDYNRFIVDVYSHTATDQGKVMYDYILGLYEVLEKLVRRYPDLLIEGCSGGGGRFDAGMLYYTPQIWCSDNTDAIDRLKIQYGTSFGYPSLVMGSHVSACPNHQTGRITPLKTRAITAMSGAFGYELNPDKLTEQEKEEVRRQIAEYREDCRLLHRGRYYRLSSPFEDAYCAWQHVSRDKSEAIVNAVIMQNMGSMPVCYVKPRGLLEKATYREKGSGKLYQSDSLMDSGLPLPLPDHDGQSYKFHFILEEKQDQ